MTMPGKMVDFESNGGTTQGYLATPASGKGPGLLVIQEWWGLVGHIKNVCDRFAAEGFSALAPGHVPRPDGQRARRRRQALHGAEHRARPRKDLRGAAAVPDPALVDAEDRRGRLLHGRPARPVRRHAQSERGRHA